MTNIEIVSLFSSLASLILAIIAIWLSFKFFDKSSNALNQANEASNNISSKVSILEKLFDKLYSDTFSIVKSNMTEMGNQLWNRISIEDKLEKAKQLNIDNLKNDIFNEMNSLLSEKEPIDIKEKKKKINEIIEKAVDQTSRIEAETLESIIHEYVMIRLKALKMTKRKLTAGDIVEQAKSDGFSQNEVIKELRKLKDDGVITYEGDVIFGPSLEIEIL